MLARRVDVMDDLSLSVIKLRDRRQGASSADEIEWVPQKQLETVLYQNGYCASTGAVYRLLQRSGVGDRALPLKKASIANDIITEDEYRFLYDHLGDVRSFTLVPLDAVPKAMERFGRDERSEAVIRALELTRTTSDVRPSPAAFSSFQMAP